MLTSSVVLQGPPWSQILSKMASFLALFFSSMAAFLCFTSSRCWHFLWMACCSCSVCSFLMEAAFLDESLNTLCSSSAVSEARNEDTVRFLFSMFSVDRWCIDALHRLNKLKSRSPEHCSPVIFVSLEWLSLP